MAKIIIFSGAGISAESGISTFRDSEGLWEEYKIEEVCQVGCLAKNREKTIEFYDKRRCELKNAKPNKTHIKIAKIKEKYNDEIAVITQNVDDLFEKTGCKDVIHLHGFLREIRCNKCNFIEDIGYKSLKEVYPNEKCPKCGKILRPNVVFFGEAAPKYKELYKAFDNCEMFIVIGTSGNVINTDMFLYGSDVKYSILNNLEPSKAIDDKLYSKVLYKPATEAIDEIIEDIETFLMKQTYFYNVPIEYKFKNLIFRLPKNDVEVRKFSLWIDYYIPNFPKKHLVFGVYKDNELVYNLGIDLKNNKIDIGKVYDEDIDFEIWLDEVDEYDENKQIIKEFAEEFVKENKNLDIVKQNKK